ncbi:MOSC N-terminal beta barrel domain-containing protein [Daldinia grandis]|nr:MOSC N-terminal beta barrel domain-containing protein [Daldinia grandis]
MGQKTLQITELYIYPIKSLRPVSLDRALLQREGLRYDRRFMLLKVEAGGGYKNIQVYHFPECALFHQALDDGHVVVTYRVPEHPLVVPPPPEQHTALRVPLNPAIAGLDTVDVKLFSSSTATYRMGDAYDAWFSACLGYRAILVYIGDNRRSVLAHAPQPEQPQTQSWLSHLTSFVPYYGQQQQPPPKEDASGLAFNEAAPFLLTSKASLRNVSARLPSGQEMDMIKFRPNIVVDEVWEESSGSEDSGDGADAPSTLAAWDEDFWAELLVGSTQRLALTANCARCVSINVDYAAGRPASGELGAVLKKLMKDRRVDAGNKWSPIFGRYAFLLPPANSVSSSGSSGRSEGQELEAEVAVGDEVKVTRRISERDTWAWPK